MADWRFQTLTRDTIHEPTRTSTKFFGVVWCHFVDRILPSCVVNVLSNMRQRRPKPKNSTDELSTSRLTHEQIRARTFQRAGKLLAAKARSVAELRERLLERC